MSSGPRGIWLDHLPAGERTATLAVIAVVLGIPSLGLGRLDLAARTADAVAIGAIAIVGIVLALQWRRHAAAGLERTAEQAKHAEAAREHERSLAISAWAPPSTGALDRLAARDPRFSLPVLVSALRALSAELPFDTAAAAEVVAAREEQGRVVVEAVVRTPGGSFLLRASRPADAPSPEPGAVPGPWKLDGSEPVARAVAAIVPDPGVAAARRALAIRDGALDADALEALIREVSSSLDAGDDACAPYLCPEGRADLAYWRAVGLPEAQGPASRATPGAGDVAWIEVEQDGWFDRIEVAVGRRVLSLRRPAARSEAPWVLWRVRAFAARGSAR